MRGVAAHRYKTPGVTSRRFALHSTNEAFPAGVEAGSRSNCFRCSCSENLDVGISLAAMEARASRSANRAGMHWLLLTLVGMRHVGYIPRV